MNLYLYRLPTSEQLPIILMGMIYDTLHCYFWKNIYPADFFFYTMKFLMDLECRGYITHKLRHKFTDTCKKLKTSQRTGKITNSFALNLGSSTKSNDKCFLHVQYHHLNPSLHNLHQTFRTTRILALSKKITHQPDDCCFLQSSNHRNHH